MTSHFDDATADALLSGREPLREDGDDDVNRGLADLAMTVRSAGTARPRPNERLDAVLEHGIEHHRERPQTDGQRARGRHRPPRVREHVRGRVRGRVAALGVVAKAGVVGAVVLAAVAGTGATGSLPGPLQVRFDAVSPFEVVPEDRVEPVADAEHLDPDAVVAEEAPVDVDAGDGDTAGSGREDQEPAELAGPGAPELREPGGLEVAADASQGRSEAGRELARQARGRADEHRERAAERRPENATEEADEAGPPEDAGSSGGSEAPGRDEYDERPPHGGHEDDHEDDEDGGAEEAPPADEQSDNGPEEGPRAEQHP